MTTHHKTTRLPQHSTFKTVLLHGARFRAVPAQTDHLYTHDILVDLEGGGHVASVTGFTTYGESCEQTDEHVAVLTASAQMLTALVDLRNAYERGYDLPWGTALDAIFAGFGAPSIGAGFTVVLAGQFATTQGPLRFCAAGTTWRVVSLGYHVSQRVIVRLVNEAGSHIVPSLDDLRLSFRPIMEGDE